jgi:hypothetical protein
MRARSSTVGARALLAALAAAAACGDGGPSRDATDSVPSTFRMTGQAMGTDESGRTGTCTMDLLFELDGEAERTRSHVTYAGTHGGYLMRTVLEPDESGLGFGIDVFGEVEIELIFPNTFIVAIPINDTPESRFYQRLSRLEGVLDGDGIGTGPWECAPLDIDQGGYVDTTVTVEGEWEVAPESES